jgi:hypothetical protein
MGQCKSLVLLAGAALSVSASAFGQASNDEVRSVVAEMLADAETRSSLLAAGDAGHDGRFFIAGDGYRLNISGILQTRYIANFRDDDNDDDFETGFQVRRAKVAFSGDINKDWFFNVRGAFERGESGNFQLDYGYAGYKFANGMRATVGQFKLPMLREELVSDSKQLTADRSVTNSAFTQDYSQGVMLDYETETWRLAGAFSDGLASRNTDITDNEDTSQLAVSGEGDYAFTARFEYLFGGNWRMFEDFTAAKGQDFGAMIGVAAHYQESANTRIITDVDRDTFQFTVDVSLEGDSWNVFGAYIGRYTSLESAVGDDDTYDSGFIVQGGWRFAENTELFARYDAILADEDNPGFGTDGDDTFNFITAGLNQYWAGHAAKGTLDLVYSFDKTTNLFNSGVLPDTGVGLLGDTEEGEIAIRAQFQLLF